MKLFTAQNGKDVTAKDIEIAIEKVQAHKADLLYIHSDMSFGLPNTELMRKDILGKLLDIVLNTGVQDIIFSTFSFSFPNGLPYDVRTSKTLMGALNDFSRKDKRGLRSIDPIMSNVHFGKNRSLVVDIGKYSCGENSTYHKMSMLDNVKFLFLGVSPEMCFTYSHFIEERLKVPYRYNRGFTGQITDYTGSSYEDTYYFFVRYHGVKAGSDPIIQQQAIANGSWKSAPLGDNFVYTLDKDGIENVYNDNIRKNIYFMLSEQPPSKLVEEYVIDNPPVVAM